MNALDWFRNTAGTCTILTVMVANLANGQGNLISISGPPDTTGQYGGILQVGGSLPGISWISTAAYSNVSISIALKGNSGATATAYLTTKIGTGTTKANEIASTSFAFPATSSLTPIFSGLDLDSGTYYLIIQQTTAGSTGDGKWLGTPTPTITAAANITANGEYVSYNTMKSYAPATSFSENFVTYTEYAVTGTPIPEPAATQLIFLFGCLVILWRRSHRIGFWR